MSKRRHGEGCWDSISVKGITYKRFRIDGHSFTGKTEKECKAKYLKWKNGQKTNLTDKKTTVKQVALEWLRNPCYIHLFSNSLNIFTYFCIVRFVFCYSHFSPPYVVIYFIICDPSFVFELTHPHLITFNLLHFN